MKSPFLACLLTILLSTVVPVQSNPVPLNQPLVTKNLPQMPQRAPFAQRGAEGFKPNALRRGAMPLQNGLNFASAVAYNSGGSLAFSVAVADVNGDGKLDLLVVNGCIQICGENPAGLVGVLLGNGDGTFQTVVTYGSGGVQANSIAVADVNGDGKPDLLVANYCGSSSFDCGPSTAGSVGVLLGNGDGTFQTAVTYGSGGFLATAVTVADVNGDEIPDLVVANQCGNDCTDGAVGVLLGNGDGTFQTAVVYDPGGTSSFSIAVADVNDDGKPDVVVANNSGTVGVLLGNGDGTFQTAVTYSSGGSQPDSVAVADVNGDGKPDILVANWCASESNCSHGSVSVLLGNGDGTFQTAVAYGSGGDQAVSVVVADVNGDGKPDLVVANQFVSDNDNGGLVGVLLGNGDGTFQEAATYGSGGYNDGASAIQAAAAAADVNRDGKPDLLVANTFSQTYGSQGSVGVLINTSLTATTTVVTSSQNPSNFGQAVTFTATVTAQPGFYKGTPTGTVSFFDGITNIGNSDINSAGAATLMTSTLSVGTHRVTAIYNGDTNFAPSTSPVLYQIVQGAIVSLSPPNLDFGNQTVNITSSPQVSTLTNTGDATLTITSINVTGANSSDFHEKNNCRTSVSPRGSCQISVTFTPSGTDGESASVSITDNAPNSPQSLPLSGVGVLPAVTLSPTSLTFATQVVYTTSPAQKVTLTNTGLGILKITSAKVSGQFGVTTDCGETLAPGDSCTANVTFKPTTKGPLSGSISITDNAPDSPQSVPLSGTGTFVQLTPTSLNFGTQPVNTTSVPKYITLVNKGDATVNFTGTGITITGTDPGDFAQQNNCGSSVPSGGNCRIKVTFTPTQDGKRTADVSVSDDGGGSPQTVPLAGTGTP